MKWGEEDSNYCLVYLCLFLASITTGLCLCFYCFCLKLQYTLSLFNSVFYSVFFCDYLNVFVVFSLYF